MPDSLTVARAHIRADGMIRLAECTCGRVVVRDGVAYYEYKDRNAARSNDRGAQLLRIEWRQLVADVEAALGSAVV